MEWNEHLQFANWPRAMICASVAYIIGCITTGYYLVLAKTGRDIREMGSGSTGARNVGRVLGKPGFFLTVLGDFSKGMLAVWLARAMSHDNFCAALAVAAVVAGHLWPVQLKFHGGKGVVTSMSALVVFDYRLAFTVAGLFVVAFIVARKSLLPAMFAFLCLPAASWYFTQNDVTIGIMAILSALILFAHRNNLAKEFVILKSEPPKI
jgi:acyl phosphate:glycerol-3-phosphate acyltransferase